MTIWQLMKILRDKGWIPRWYNEVIHTVYDKKHKMIWLYKEGKEYLELVYKKSLRDFCSKESWLWQFVCENGMYNKLEISDNRTKNYDAYHNESDDTYSWDDYGYRLIESALCEEDKLEEFLLDNIKIDDK